MNHAYLKAAIPVLLFAGMLLFSCGNSEFCNPSDPLASDCPSRLIDNFDDGKDPNLLRLNPEFFYQIPDSENVWAKYVNERDNVHGGQGYAIRIDFDVSAPGNSFGGWVQPVGEKASGGFDATRFAFLTFWAKADMDSINFEMSLKDVDDRETDSKPLLSDLDNLGLTRSWKKLSIPLSELVKRQNKEPVNSAALLEVIFAFSKGPFEKKGGRLKGTFYIDEIALEQKGSS